MKYEIEFTLTASEDLMALRATDRAKIEDAIERHLRYEPEKISKSRIKRLRHLLSPQYRLRVDDHRVFYDVAYHIDLARGVVTILAIKHKSATTKWLADNEVNDETDSIE